MAMRRRPRGCATGTHGSCSPIGCQPLSTAISFLVSSSPSQLTGNRSWACELECRALRDAACRWIDEAHVSRAQEPRFATLNPDHEVRSSAPLGPRTHRECEHPIGSRREHELARERLCPPRSRHLDQRAR